MIIDANNLILGRLAAIVAKKALMGEKIDIVNCEKSVITGDRLATIERYRVKIQRGTHAKGPFVPKRPDLLVKRTIRGMIPYRRERGIKAMKAIKCYIGVPEEFKNQKFEIIKEASISKLPNMNFTYVGEISKLLGSKV